MCRCVMMSKYKQRLALGGEPLRIVSRQLCMPERNRLLSYYAFYYFFSLYSSAIHCSSYFFYYWSYYAVCCCSRVSGFIAFSL